MTAVYPIITGIVLAVLIYAFVELRRAYGTRTLLTLFFLTIAFFYVKEYLQANNLLLHHYYHPNRTIWLQVFGVPPFVVVGHLFVVVLTWQFAVQYLHRLKLDGHPAVFVTLVWYFTSAVSLLMENTGVVGGWWTWAMPSWWFYPNLLGAPLVDLPWERPITTAWGYFISVYWFMLLITDLSRRWTVPRVLVLFGGLAALLELSRLTLFMSFWAAVWVPLLPFLSIVLAPSRAGPAWRFVFPARSALLAERPLRWNGAVLVALAAMLAVCVAQIAVAGRWLALVSLYPILTFAVGMFRPWPVWVDLLGSVAVLLLGFTLNNGNLMLAGWLVFRCSLLLALVLAAIRWRAARRRRAAPGPAPAQSSAAATGSSSPSPNTAA